MFVVNVKTAQRDNDGKTIQQSSRSIPAMSLEDANEIALAMNQTAHEGLDRYSEVCVSVKTVSTSILIPIDQLRFLVSQLTTALNEVDAQSNEHREAFRKAV